MSDLKDTIYRMALGRSIPLTGPLNLSWIELLAFLWHRGGPARIRGVWRGWRLGSCGGRLFVGARTRLMFPRQIHVGRNVAIGDDSYISGFSVKGMRLGSNVRIREGAWIQATSTLDQPGVGLVIGDDTYIAPRVILGAGGGIHIGARVLVGAAVHVLAENHNFSDPARPIQAQGVTRTGIVVEDDAWIGNGVIVLDGVTIGRGAVVGAGSVVTHDVPAGAVAVGNPARVIRHRSGAPVA